MSTDPTTDNVWAALARVQTELPHVTADATGHHRNKYATLATVNREVLPLLGGHGLCWTVTTDVEAGVITGTLTHAATGTAITSTWPMPRSTDPQQVASGLTYSRRYLLCSVVGVAADDDDDGQAASNGARARAAEPAPAPADTRRRAAELVAEHVPAELVAVLADVYEAGSVTLGDLSDVSIGRIVNALSDPGKRATLLAGLATRTRTPAPDPQDDRPAPAPQVDDPLPLIDSITDAIRSRAVTREAVDRAYRATRNPMGDKANGIASASDLQRVSYSTLAALWAAIDNGSLTPAPQDDDGADDPQVDDDRTDPNVALAAGSVLVARAVVGKAVKQGGTQGIADLNHLLGTLPDGLGDGVALGEAPGSVARLADDVVVGLAQLLAEGEDVTAMLGADS